MADRKFLWCPTELQNRNFLIDTTERRSASLNAKRIDRKRHKFNSDLNVNKMKNWLHSNVSLHTLGENILSDEWKILIDSWATLNNKFDYLKDKGKLRRKNEMRRMERPLRKLKIVDE